MPTQILIKRSSTASAVPTTVDLAAGELAINTVDKRIFTNNSGTIVELGTYPTTQSVVGNATVGGTFGVTGATTLSSGTVSGNWTVTGTLTVSTPSNSTDAASKGYVDTSDALKVSKAGDSMSGALSMSSNKITSLGTPTADTDAATKGYVDAQVSAVLDAAPAALDTLNELAAAINDDANFAGTVTTALASKLNLSGGTMTGDITMGANKVTSTATPTVADDLTRKGYVDTQDALKVTKSGDTMSGTLDMGANKVTTTLTPTTADELTRKGYVDSILGSATDAATSAADAATSAAAAAVSASNAATSETNASVSASSASTSATNAATSATNAASSASSASSSATAAASSAGVASLNATSAADSASSAATSATDAAASAASAASSDYATSSWYTTTNNASNWDTAYGWGDHASAGYVVSTGGTMTGDLSFGDNNKATFGAGSDLRIYHDGSNSYVQDFGTGNLIVRGTNLQLRGNTTNELFMNCVENGNINLYYDNAIKLATTSTGIDVTGDIVVDNASATVDLTSDAGGEGILSFNSGVGAVKYSVNGDRIGLFTNSTEKVRLDTSGNVTIGSNLGTTTPAVANVAGIALRSDGHIQISRDSNTSLQVNRITNDGILVQLRQDGTAEGTISVSGTTVSYNGGHLARWSQLADNTRDASLVKGTVLTNLDQMAVWGDEDNEQLNCMAVSTVEGDPNVAGVFVNWDDDDEDYTNDMNIAMTGDMVIRIAQGTTVQRGDLLMSAGDGTAKPQGDDIVRSKTIAKVTSTHVSHTYNDGSYLVPCVLMAC